MKKIFFPLFLLLLSTPVLFGQFGQDYVDKVDWTYSVNRLSDTEAELIFKAKMKEGWHIYANDLDTNSAAFPTEVVWEESEAYTLNGGTIEPKPKEEYDPNFEEVLKYHEEEISFRQKILIHTKEDFTVTGELIFMACNDRMCEPPKYLDVEYKVKGAANPVVKESVEIDYNDPSGEGTDDSSSTSEDPERSLGDEGDEPRSLGWTFVLCFLGGFAALITPCVFPMVPMTVSFFTKQSKTKSAGIRNALIYSFCIILIYVLLSAPFHVFTSISPNIFNNISTNVYLNLFFFLIFIVFAISFFGAFEITLPSSWINKADKASDSGGVMGIFFMALVLVLVSFSCTGPLLGVLLGSVLSTDGGATALTIGMLGFGLGLALPFGLFAAFPSWLNTLPKSGGWLNSVKVVLGFLELALAFKFLSNADLVVQAGLLQREVFLAIWIAIFAALTLYLFGAFKMPHDSPLNNLSVTRMLMGLLFFSFTVYLIPGLWGAPLKPLSGLTPPMFYSESPRGIGGSAGIASEEVPDGAEPDHCPHFLNCFHEFERGVEYAKEVNKPILLDFTGWACANCRKMEEEVWSDPRVLKILREDIVLISLHVDDKNRLPKEDYYKSEYTGDNVRTIGGKWAEFQFINFKQSTQPQYVLLGHDGLEPLNGSTSYDPDIDFYLKWLKQGISRFKDHNSNTSGH